MSQHRQGSWVTCFQPDPAVRLRLFCLPYGGGGASIFRDWPAGLPARTEVWAVQLPGREDRVGENPFDRMDSLVPALGAALLPYMDRPFALFGHSIGALIAFNLARWLREHAGLSPALLLVSGRYAPHLPSLRPAVHALPDDRFFAELKYYGATPDELLHDEDLRALFLPVLRADFALFETATYISQAPLSCPIVALSGQDDHTVTLERVEAWREHTTNRFTLRELPGGHFFLNTHRGALLAALGEELVPVLVADSSARRSWLPRRQPSPLDR